MLLGKRGHVAHRSIPSSPFNTTDYIYILKKIRPHILELLVLINNLHSMLVCSLILTSTANGCEMAVGVCIHDGRERCGWTAARTFVPAVAVE